MNEAIQDSMANHITYNDTKQGILYNLFVFNPAPVKIDLDPLRTKVRLILTGF